MKRRPRPLQLSMLTLMGSEPERREPFAGSIITSLEYDQDGNVTSVTVEGAEYVEAKRLATEATQVVAEAAGRQTVDQPTSAVALERDPASNEEQHATQEYWTAEAVEQTED